MITREYLTQRRTELVDMQANAIFQADQAEARSKSLRGQAQHLGGSIQEIDALLAMLEPKAPPPAEPPPAQ